MRARHRDDGARPYSPNRLYRDWQRGLILGVCAGIADYLGVSPLLVRFAALIGLFMFSVPTILAYFVAAALIERKPENLHPSGTEEEFWRSVRTEPRHTVGELRHKFREVERRLRRTEGLVHPRGITLNRQFRD